LFELIKGCIMEKILVWDIPTRIGHWMLASAFIVAFLSGDSEQWRLIHVMAGFAMLGVLAFRLLWGVIGTRYARFDSFLFTPRQVYAYLAGLLKGNPVHWIGHNPAGSYAIFALLLFGAAVVFSGWAVYADAGGEWLAQAHEALSYAMLCMVGLHLAGVFVSSRLHGENLLRSMVTGFKQGKGADAIASSKKYWVILLLGMIAASAMLSLQC
jgi:cytochrome b